MDSKALFVNVLTFSRVPFILGWMALAIVQAYLPVSAAKCCLASASFWTAWAAGAFMFASGLTDLFDGKLARKWNVVTPLGKMADPLMDKVFYVVTFPTITWLLARQGEGEAHALLMLGFTILYILRDLWVTFMRSVGSQFGADGAAMWLGKVRTALSFPAAGWIYAYATLHVFVPENSAWRDWWLYLTYAVEAFMIVLNFWSTVTYTRVYLPYLKKALERK